MSANKAMKVKINCSFCKELFEPKKWVVWSINRGEQKKRYCSPHCRARGRTKLNIPFLAHTPEYTQAHMKLRDNERHKKQVADWYQRNKERTKEKRKKQHKIWVEKNKEKVRIYLQRDNEKKKAKRKNDPEYAQKVRDYCNYYHSKKKYGEYADAHRLLCKTEIILKGENTWS